MIKGQHPIVENYICQICKRTIKVPGFYSHTRTHNISCHEYKDKYGEISSNKKSFAERLQNNICDLCNEQLTPKQKWNHIKNIHNLSAEEYCIKLYYNGEKPKCKCGCNKYTTFESFAFNLRGGFREYISGHNPNGMTGLKGELCPHYGKHNMTENGKKKNSESMKKRWEDGSMKEKIIISNLETYGVDHHMKSETVKDKLIESHLEKFGYKWHLADPAFRRKYCSKSTVSKFEREVLAYIQTFEPSAISQYQIGHYYHLYDIGIPDKKIIVECNGEHVHVKEGYYDSDDTILRSGETVKYSREKDKARERFANSRGYKVIVVWYGEWNGRKSQRKEIENMLREQISNNSK